jgi:signal transduction histidine kinase/ABC-type uncharacterized transport system substrate-binding protein
MPPPITKKLVERQGFEQVHSVGLGPMTALIMVLAAAFLFLRPPHAHAQKPIRRVLIFNDFSPVSSPGIALLDQSIVGGLDNNKYQMEVYAETIEAALFSDESSQHRIHDWYPVKYADRKPDVIVTVGPSSLRFMIESQAKLFANTPTVFCATTEEMLDQLKLSSLMTGVFVVAQPEKTLLAALKLQPNTRHVFVTGGAGRFDRDMEGIARAAFRKYESKLEFTYFTDLDMPTLLTRLRSLPPDSIVYHTAITQDAAGNHFIDSAQSVPLVVSASNAPVFVADDVDLGRGTVGGDLISWAVNGRAAGAIIDRVLNGERPQDIPISKSDNVYMFDWRALRRWGFKESNLPPGSAVLFRQPSVWERTKWVWIAALLIILGLSALAIYLHINRKRLRRARDEQLQLSGMLINAEEKERSRLASELHDDFSQRLALLTLGLENAADTLPEKETVTRQQLHDLLNSASELGADIHTLSHRLHSSTLQNLGLIPGVSALCKEFSGRHGIEVDFSSENVPRPVDPDVALCSFRIVQEGLQNLKKHSGATKGQVNLRNVGNKLHISVYDQGRGFDMKQMKDKAGLGIRSMGERVHLLNGRFEIHSEPGKGTRIEACIPLHSANGHVEN